MQKEALFLPPLTIASGNLVNLEKTSDISPIKGELLSSYSKQNFGRKLKKSSFKISIEGPILLVFVNSSQIFSCWSTLTKFKAFLTISLT